MTAARDRAMILVGFWRGFRSDELVNLMIEDIRVEPGRGMTIYLPRSKTDRNNVGRYFVCPALSRLCPVAAYEAWLATSKLDSGPVFRGVNRWGDIGEKRLATAGIVRWLRKLFHNAGIADAEEFSSHSLRRGFAGWARTSGWDIRDLMEYVGWQDVQSAMRYFDLDTDALQQRFERSLEAPTRTSPAPSAPIPSKRKPDLKLV